MDSRVTHVRSGIIGCAATEHDGLELETAVNGWRPRPELNRGTRICSPLRHHSATWPLASLYRTRRQRTTQGKAGPGLLAFSSALPQLSRLPHNRGTAWSTLLPRAG